MENKLRAAKTLNPDKKTAKSLNGKKAQLSWSNGCSMESTESYFDLGAGFRSYMMTQQLLKFQILVTLKVFSTFFYYGFVWWNYRKAGI